MDDSRQRKQIKDDYQDRQHGSPAAAAVLL